MFWRTHVCWGSRCAVLILLVLTNSGEICLRNGADFSARDLKSFLEFFVFVFIDEKFPGALLLFGHYVTLWPVSET